MLIMLLKNSLFVQTHMIMGYAEVICGSIHGPQIMIDVILAT
jgi:hypothetical protein